MDQRESQQRTPKTNPSPAELAKLRQNLAKYFNLGELRTLCFDLGISYEDLPQTRAEMAMGIVEYCERQVCLDELVSECQRLRPRVDW